MTFLLISLLVTIGAVKSLLRAICIKKDHIGPVFVIAVLMIPAGVFVSLYSFIFLEVDLAVSVQILPYLAITIPCFVIGSVLSIKALQYMEASLYTIVDQIIILASLVAAAWLLLGETLYGWQWLGLACLGIGIATTRFSAGAKHLGLSKGLIYTALGASLIGIGLVVDKIILNQAGLATFLFTAPSLVSLGALLFYLAWQKWHQLPFWPARQLIHWPALITASALGVISLYVYLISLDRIDNIAYLNAMTSFTLILAVVLEMIVLKELSNLRVKLIGSSLAVVGLFLLA